MAKQKGETIQWPNKRHCMVSPFYLAMVLFLLFIWPLYCLSFLFGHCIVSPFYLAIILSLLFIWPLYCLSFLLGHCIVSPFYLAIVLTLLETIQWPNKKERQYNDQIKRRDNTMAK
jgi:Zn-dependent protease with chaperone function